MLYSIFISTDIIPIKVDFHYSQCETEDTLTVHTIKNRHNFFVKEIFVFEKYAQIFLIYKIIHSFNE